MLSEKWETLPEIQARIGGDLNDIGRRVRLLVAAKKADKRYKKFQDWQVLQFRERPSNLKYYVVFDESGKPLDMLWAKKPSEANRIVRKALKIKRGFKTTVTANSRIKPEQRGIVNDFWMKHGPLK